MVAVSAAIGVSKSAQDQARWHRCLQGIRAKDPQALAWLYDETSSVLYGLALRMLHQPAPAEALLLAIYQLVWEKPDVVAEGNFLESLILLTRSRALEEIRRDGKTVPLEGPGDSRTAGPPGISGQNKETAGVLKLLSPEERQAMELAFFRGLSATEIAGQLAVPVDTIRKRICTAMSKLRQASATAAGEKIH